LRERRLLEQHSSRTGQDQNGATVFFMPTPSGVEAAGLLRRSAANVLSHDALDEALPDEEELDSALQAALESLE
jgi:hypothetical protein